MLLILACAGYVMGFNWIYQSYVSPTFSYLGFALMPLSSAIFWQSFMLASLPSLWMPLHLRRPSQFIYWIIYLLVYVPSIFVPSFMALQPADMLVLLQLMLFFGIVIIGLCAKVPYFGMKRIPLPPRIFWFTLGAIGLASSVYVYCVYRGHFKLVSFAEVYQKVRFSGGELAEGTMVNYAIMLLGGAINPFLMSYAMIHRRWLLFAVGALGQLLLYATAGQKIYIISIVLLPLVAFVLRKNGGRAFGLRLALLMTFGCVGLNGVRQLTADVDNISPWDGTASLVFMRTLAIPGMLTGLYYDFFLSHPRTHYSHVHGVNLLISYPFDKDLGRTVGFEYSGNPDLNANAHFWAVDGLAALGLAGVLVSSLFCGAVFWLIDAVTVRHEPYLGTLLSVMPTMMLTNTSIFTTLLSGGLAFCILLLCFLPVSSSTARDKVVVLG